MCEPKDAYEFRWPTVIIQQGASDYAAAHSFASSSAKLYREWREGIDQRRKESIDKWNAEHPDQPKEFKPYITWGEEQDLKIAEMKRLREQEQARLREQAASAS